MTLCGVFPIAAGTAALLWWWETRSDAAVQAGIWTVTGGVILAAIGGTLLTLRLLVTPRPPLRVTIPLAIIFIANPVVAYVYSELIIREIRADRGAGMAPGEPPPDEAREASAPPVDGAR